MGNAISNTGRYIVRKTRRFNVDNRTEKFMEREKLPMAPKHPSTQKIFDEMTKDPVIREQLINKSTQLDEHLKQVYVKSLHASPMTIEEEKEKLQKSKLPKDRSWMPQSKFGHEVPTIIRKGKYSMSQAIDMISEHNSDPMTNTPSVLAEKYNLDPKIVDSILLYYRFFKVEASSEQKQQQIVAKQVMSKYAEATMKRLMQETGHAVSARDDVALYTDLEEEVRKEELKHHKKLKEIQDKIIKNQNDFLDENEIKKEPPKKVAVNDVTGHNDKNSKKVESVKSVLERKQTNIDTSGGGGSFKNVSDRKKKTDKL